MTKRSRWNPYASDEERREARREALSRYNNSPKGAAARARFASDRRQDGHLRWLYGIGLEDYLNLMAYQDDLCLVCHKRDIQLYVDHNHQTGRVRGLLCNLCNVSLGRLEDSPHRVGRAIKYLTNKPEFHLGKEREKQNA